MWRRSARTWVPLPTSPTRGDTLDPPVRREDGDLVIALFSSRLGCFGSLLVSALLTALVILVLYR
jgi:hypothetical protein